MLGDRRLRDREVPCEFPQQLSRALAMVCKIRNRVGSARAFVILMTCCGVSMVAVH